MTCAGFPPITGCFFSNPEGKMLPFAIYQLQGLPGSTGLNCELEVSQMTLSLPPHQSEASDSLRRIPGYGNADRHEFGSANRGRTSLKIPPVFKLRFQPLDSNRNPHKLHPVLALARAIEINLNHR
jgi:hypothetical protein